MIIVSSYTANLAAFLVAESRVTVIESVEDFKACGKQGQPKCKASFGAKRHGSTLKFFEVRLFDNQVDLLDSNMEIKIRFFRYKRIHNTQHTRICLKVKFNQPF